MLPNVHVVSAELGVVVRRRWFGPLRADQWCDPLALPKKVYALVGGGLGEALGVGTVVVCGDLTGSTARKSGVCPERLRGPRTRWVQGARDQHRSTGPVVAGDAALVAFATISLGLPASNGWPRHGKTPP